MKKKIYKRIIEKALELCMQIDKDELIYGTSFVEIGDRSIIVIDPKDVNRKISVSDKNLKGKSVLKK